MPPDTLEFEEPIAVLLKEIEALSMLPQTPEREREIDGLNRRIESIRADIYARLTPWQRVLVARHPSRPTMLDYVNRLFTDFIEIRGDCPEPARDGCPRSADHRRRARRGRERGSAWSGGWRSDPDAGVCDLQRD